MRMDLGPYLLGPNDTTENGIYMGDARVLAEAIPADSVDLIFTDPPYPREFIPLFGATAEIAARVLRPGGFCIVYVGGTYLPEILALMTERLRYHWHLSIYQPGDNCILWPKRIMSGLKLLLCFSKGPAQPRCLTRDVFVGTAADKRYHIWGQEEGSARYYVDSFSAPGDVVLDPFTGGGTTPAVCKMLHRPFLGFEIDSATAAIARDRVRDTQMPMMDLTRQDALDFGEAQ